jgi:hypothetical protein
VNYLAPLQDLSILRDQNHSPTANHEACLAGCPIFLRSPQRCKNFDDHSRYGSSFQIRYFLPGSLSFEPLGTTVIMLQMRTGVNAKMQLSSRNNCL